MTTKQRKYSLGDAEMLITASTITESAIANKAFLQGKRSSWQDPFFENLNTRIDTSIQNYLGVDSAKALRQSTQALNIIQKQALKDLAEAKIQISEDFKKDKVKRDEILTQLGFATYDKIAQKGNHEALISLLYQFKTNLSDTLRADIVAKGTADQALTAITGYADTLKKANVTQESYKGSRGTITTTVVTEFNDIYDQIISICKIACKFYKDQPTLKDQFTYSKVANALKSKGKSSAKPATTDAAKTKNDSSANKAGS
jgi:hypothetical protein